MPRWLLIVLLIFGVAVFAAVAAWYVGHRQYRARTAEAEAAWADILAQTTGSVAVYDPAMVADLPEIAQRYFAHAIAPGTPLHTTVMLEMDGSFHLGKKDAPQTYAMTARQILAPPDQFVWIPEMRSGPLVISGSDALYQDHAWTRFWMMWSLPVAQAAATEGLDRAALARPALEAIWAPATLLPQNGARWEQTGPDTARVTLGTGEKTVAIDLTLTVDGRVMDIVTQRWSNANPQSTYQYQPFGGAMAADTTFEGFTIPSDVQVGNFFGTEEYFPFFEARITAATYY